MFFMRPLCEIMVMDIFPTIRALLAKEMKMLGCTQIEIARKLCITQPAISQYERALRGNKAQLLMDCEEIIEKIKKSAVKLVKNENNYSEVMCDICKSIKNNTKLLCSLCRVGKNDCKICFSKDLNISKL